MKQFARSHIRFRVLKQIYNRYDTGAFANATMMLTVRTQTNEEAPADAFVAEVLDVVFIAILIAVDAHESVKKSSLTIHLAHRSIARVLAHCNNASDDKGEESEVSLS